MAKKDYSQLWEAACAAGRRAAEACVPQPIVVAEANGLTSEPLPGGRSWCVPDGLCGFAWVQVRPGNSPFANWLKARGLGTADHYAGGVRVSVRGYNQSVAKKEAYAYAAAEVLRAAGIKACADSRLD